ncbi:MAG: hypothetical protein QOF51_2467 [Chloroflexota bacterium]|jgi:hypothetical protein|nr:hypothetical protein [Chloroflexota bacterium]
MSVMPQVAQAAADATVAIVPRADPHSGGHNSVPTMCPPDDISDTKDDLQTGKTPRQEGWGGWDLNPGPRDYAWRLGVLTDSRCLSSVLVSDLSTRLILSPVLMGSQPTGGRREGRVGGMTSIDGKAVRLLEPEPRRGA